MRRAVLGPVFTTAELAEVLDWDSQRVRRFVLNHGIVQKGRKWQRIQITYQDLLNHAPELYYSLLAAGVIRVGGCG